jgi:transcriptional antiterminator NusG
MVPSRNVPERREGLVYPAVRPLFPGYIFIQVNMSLHIYKQLHNCHRVYRVLRNEAAAGEYWSSIPEAEMKPILSLVGNGQVIEYSTVFVQNSKVHVVRGPLRGMEGIIRKLDKRKNRAKIAVSFMETEHLVEVGIEVLSLTSPSGCPGYKATLQPPLSLSGGGLEVR